MSSAAQSPVDALASSIKEEIATSLQSGPDKLSAISGFSQRQLPRFSFLGEDLAKEIIVDRRAGADRASGGPATGVGTEERLVEWLSSELSEKISADLIDFTVRGVTERRIGSSVEHDIQGSLELDLPLKSQVITKFTVKFDGGVVAELGFTVDVEAKLTINDVVTRVQEMPTRRMVKIELRDCEAGVEVSGPGGIALGEFTVPIKGQLVS